MRASKVLLSGVVGVASVALVTCATLAQQRVGERVGERVQDVGRSLKRGVEDISDAVRKRFEVVRADVNRMEAHSRVYSRLHWDKELNGSKFEVHMLRDGTVVLQGSVPDPEARKHAVELASETVGVTGVIDSLTTINETDAPKPQRARAPR